MIYRSNLSCPDLTPHFRLLSKVRPYSMGHEVPSDPRYEPDCGYWTHDEAAILYNVAKEWDTAWVDIGCRFGWTTAHIIAADVSQVYAVDPIFKTPGMELRLLANGVDSAFVKPYTAAEFFVRATARNAVFGGFCIDGDHDPPQPLLDAKACVSVAEDACVVLLHDFMGRPIRDAVDWLIDNGFRCRVYNTPNMVACCWRFHPEDLDWFKPPNHVGDPRIDWGWIRQVQLRDFDFSRTE